MKDFFSSITRGPLEQLLQLLGLPPDHLFASIVLLGFAMVAFELVRIALATELTRSAPVHVLMCFLTVVIPSVLLGFVLVWAARSHPGRGWINLAIAAGLYGLWYATGEFTKVMRRQNEGADVGFMTVGGFITFPAGIVAALIYS